MCPDNGVGPCDDGLGNWTGTLHVVADSGLGRRCRSWAHASCKNRVHAMPLPPPQHPYRPHVRAAYCNRPILHCCSAVADSHAIVSVQSPAVPRPGVDFGAHNIIGRSPFL